MNKTVEKAIKISGEYVPDLEIGEICEINDLWNGTGEVPEDSFSICLDDGSEPKWINYNFETIEVNENPLNNKIKITEIELL